MLLSDHFRSNSHLTPWPCADHHPVQKTNAFAPHPLCFAEGWVRNLVQVQSSPFTKDWSLFRIIMIPKMSLNVTFFFTSGWSWDVFMLTLDIFDFMICNMQGALSTAVQKLMFFTSKLHSPHKTAARPWRTMMNLLRFVSKLGLPFCTWKKPYTKKCWVFYSKPCETNQLWGHLIARHTHILSIGMV